MRTQKLTTTDGFVVVDLDDAPRSDGIVRVARKILHDGAVNLARERTYSFAALSVRVGGASAGLNSEAQGAAAAVASMIDELDSQVTDGSLRLTPAKGVPPGSLDIWTPPRPADISTSVAVSAMAALEVALADREQPSVGVDADSPHADAVAREMAARYPDVRTAPLDDLLSDERDVLCVGSRPGAFDHECAARSGAVVVVPIAPLAVSAKGLAVGSRAGAVVLPGFVTTAGAVAPATDLSAADLAARVRAITTTALADPEGPFLGACRSSEAFLATWTDERPFGRPLA